MTAVVAVALLAASCSPKAGADPVPTDGPVTNERTGDLVVFHQNYATMSGVPGNITLAANTVPYLAENETLTYQTTNKAVRLNVTQNPSGYLIVGGLSPSLVTTVSMDIKMGRTNFNAELNVIAANAWLQFTIAEGSPSDTLRMRSYYYNSVLESSVSEIKNIGNDSARFTLTIRSDTTKLKNTIYINGTEMMTTPVVYGDQKYLPTAYDPFMNPSTYFYYTLIAPGSTAHLELYSITQTVPQYRYVTPVSDARMVPFGLDGPHKYEFVDDGMAQMAAGGQRLTIWADVLFLHDVYSAEDIAALKKLMAANGWELGIHYSLSLNKMSWEDAVAMMDREYSTVAGIFGTPPTSWCSLGNADNSTHADYAFKKYGMVWRNGKNGVHILSTIGNIEDANWGFWSAVSSAGAVFPVFTHRLDTSPAIKFSISPAILSAFLGNYAKNGVQIVGFREYWDTIQNSYHTTISNLRFEKGVSLTFSVDNMGGQSRLFIAAPTVASVLDSTQQSVPLEKADGGVIIRVKPGDYRVLFSTPITSVPARR